MKSNFSNNIQDWKQSAWWTSFSELRLVINREKIRGTTTHDVQWIHVHSKERSRRVSFPPHGVMMQGEKVYLFWEGSASCTCKLLWKQLLVSLLPHEQFSPKEWTIDSLICQNATIPTYRTPNRKIEVLPVNHATCPL